ncbi:MAG: hypothetical protein WC767_00990 [Candidatus Paceibacterota bacterium]|jgi:uncharacterized membrane protein
MSPLSLKDSFKSAWSTFMKSPGVFVTVTFIFLVVGLIVDSGNDSRYSLVVNIANTLISFFAAYVMVKLSLAAARGEVPSWREAVSVKARPFWYFILASILVGVIDGIGLILLVIPGLYLLARLALFNFAIVDEDLSPIESVKRAWALSRGRFWKMFLAGLIIIGMNVLGVVLLGIGVLVSSPVSFLFSAYIYEKLKSDSLPVVE